jgi:hypothetical protein
MIKLPIFILILVLVFSACSGIEENPNYEKTGKWFLSPIRSYDLEMSVNVYLDYCYFENKSTLLCLDHKLLKFYDIYKQVVYKTDTLDLPDGFYPEALRYIAPGIIGVSSNMPYKLIVYNLHTKKKDFYDLVPNNKIAKVAPAPDLSRCGVDLKINDFLFLAGVCVGEGKYSVGDRLCGISLNLATHKYSYFMDFPKIYYKYNWGGLYYRMPYMTANKYSDIVFSFPASHNLYIYNTLTKNIKSIPGGSSLVKEILPFSDNQDIKVTMIKEELINYYFNNPSYSFITFDKYRNLYYRLVEHPNPDYGKSNIYYKPFSLIILDKSFLFLGESKISQLGYSPQIIVTEKHIIMLFYNQRTKKRGFTIFNVLNK